MSKNEGEQVGQASRQEGEETASIPLAVEEDRKPSPSGLLYLRANDDDAARRHAPAQFHQASPMQPVASALPALAPPQHSMLAVASSAQQTGEGSQQHKGAAFVTAGHPSAVSASAAAAAVLAYQTQAAAVVAAGVPSSGLPHHPQSTASAFLLQQTMSLSSSPTMAENQQLPSPPSSASSAGAGEQPARTRRRRRKSSEIKRKDPGLPKRPITAYNLYFREERARILESVQDQENDGETPFFETVAKRIGEGWRNLSKEERTPYLDRAAVDKRRYDAEMLVYREQQQKAKKKQKTEQDQPVTSASVPKRSSSGAAGDSAAAGAKSSSAPPSPTASRKHVPSVAMAREWQEAETQPGEGNKDRCSSSSSARHMPDIRVPGSTATAIPATTFALRQYQRSSSEPSLHQATQLRHRQPGLLSEQEIASNAAIYAELSRYLQEGGRQAEVLETQSQRLLATEALRQQILHQPFAGTPSASALPTLDPTELAARVRQQQLRQLQQQRQILLLPYQQSALGSRSDGSAMALRRSSQAGDQPSQQGGSADPRLDASSTLPAELRGLLERIHQRQTMLQHGEPVIGGSIGALSGVDAPASSSQDSLSLHSQSRHDNVAGSSRRMSVLSGSVEATELVSVPSIGEQKEAEPSGFGAMPLRRAASETASLSSLLSVQQRRDSLLAGADQHSDLYQRHHLSQQPAHLELTPALLRQRLLQPRSDQLSAALQASVSEASSRVTTGHQRDLFHRLQQQFSIPRTTGLGTVTSLPFLNDSIAGQSSSAALLEALRATNNANLDWASVPGLMPHADLAQQAIQSSASPMAAIASQQIQLNRQAEQAHRLSVGQTDQRRSPSGLSLSSASGETDGQN